MRRTICGLLVLAASCSVDADIRRGRDALASHDLDAAEWHFREALERQPGHVGALAGLGWTLQAGGQTEAARRAFERCLEKRPETVECLRGRASVAMADGDPQAGRRALDQARALAPDDPAVLNSAALLSLAVGDLDAAGEQYATLAARSPGRAEVLLGLGEVRFQQRRFDEALAAVDGGLDLVSSGGVERRHEVLLWILRARVLVASTGNRVDPARCDETVPPVLAWLDGADRALQKARATGVDAPDLPAAERLVLRRRAAVAETCPPPRGGSG